MTTKNKSSSDLVFTKKFNASMASNLSYFLFAQIVFVLASKNSRYFEQNFFIHKNFWAKFFLAYRLNLPLYLNYIVDGCQFVTDQTFWTVRFNVSNMLVDQRCAVITQLTASNLSLDSTSTLYKSSIWLERELSDFTNINFLSLIDTRRLLLDYFEEKQLWQTHISNDKNFDNTIYDVNLSY